MMLTGDNSVTVTELDDSVDCQYLKMRTLGIVEAQEAMETGVFIWELGHPDSMARGLCGGKPHLEHKSRGI
jgi:hypothetical protein